MQAHRFALIAAAMLASTAPALAMSPAEAMADPRRPAEDRARDAARKPEAMLVFAGVRPGMVVLDFIPGHGYFTRLFADAVKPGGRVIADVPAVVQQHDPQGVALLDAMAADPAYGDVTVKKTQGGLQPNSLDIVWTAQNYHDLVANLQPADVAAFNASIFAALKPGGVFVVVDHVANPGDPSAAAHHRIDPAMVKRDVLAAGFVFDGESSALRNPADDHSTLVFVPAIRGHTDQFAYRFRKPA